MVWINAMSNSLSKCDSKFCPDVIIQTQDGKVFMHKIVLVAAISGFDKMFCDHCVESHENILIVVPEVTKDEVQAAVDELYTTGKGESVVNLFGVKEKDYKEFIQAKIQLDGDKENNFKEEVLQNAKTTNLQVSFMKNTLELNKEHVEGDQIIPEGSNNIKLEKFDHEMINEYDIKCELELEDDLLHEETKPTLNMKLDNFKNDETKDENDENAAVVFLKDTYPDLYMKWKEVLKNAPPPIPNRVTDDDNPSPFFKALCTRTDNMCIVCKLRPIEGAAYGVGICEADRSFIKRTFCKKLSYPACSQGGSCPPKPGGWCQACRLAAALQTPINVASIYIPETETESNIYVENIEDSKDRIADDKKLDNNLEEASSMLLSNFLDVSDIMKGTTTEENESFSKNAFKSSLNTSLMSKENDPITTCPNTDAAVSPLPANRNNRKMYVGAEAWLKETSPDLYKVWKNACKIPNITDGFLCSVCKLKPGAVHYGVRLCEAEKQFIKRTFHMMVTYPPCTDQQKCPPRTRGWCQACRIRACLARPIDFSLVRVGKMFMRSKVASDRYSTITSPPPLSKNTPPPPTTDPFANIKHQDPPPLMYPYHGNPDTIWMNNQSRLHEFWQSFPPQNHELFMQQIQSHNNS